MGKRTCARLPLGLYQHLGAGGATTFSWGVCTIDSSSMFISVHVGATSDLLCMQEGKTMAKVQFLLYTNPVILNVGEHGFCKCGKG